MNSERLFLVDPYDEDHMKLVEDFEKENEIHTMTVENAKKIQQVPREEYEQHKKLANEVRESLFLESSSKIKDICYIEGERDIKTCNIYFAPIKGLGGYPIGSLGKGILMLSGGIDSPVAGYLAMKRGVKLEALYFESPPHTSVEAKNKVLSLAHTLSKYGSEINVHIIPFTEIQEAIYKNIPSDYMVTIMRRMMYRIATRMAYKNKCKIIVNGESIGQVASQTLSSMSVINEVTVMPVIRPVACFDKLEIIDIAKKIGTYETSILPFEDCCTIFVPKHPVINPELEKCISYEELIPYEELINKAIHDSKVERFTMQEDYSDLL